LEYSLKQFSLKLAFLFISGALIVGCNPTQMITGTDLSNMYTGKKENTLQIDQLYHINDSTSILRINIPAGLIASESGFDSKLSIGKLNIEIFPIDKHVSVTDSITFTIVDTFAVSTFLSQTWAFKAMTGMEYFVKAEYSIQGNIDDMVLMQNFSKTNHFKQPWFRFQSEIGGMLSGNVTGYAQSIRMVREDTLDAKFYVSYYTANFPSAQPPFAKEDKHKSEFKPDSTFVLEMRKGKSDYFTPAKTGIYFFQNDSSIKQGPTLLRMKPGYPKVTNHMQMVEALQYITTAKEFQDMLSSSYPKMVVDSFWIVHTGRDDLATELIKKYYSHIEIANSLFSSYTEGWKTDRGMIYAVLGKPTQVFRSFNHELWIYGNYDDPNSLEFDFEKVDNQFTDNDYKLMRSQIYQNIWYEDVQLWRR
jgi:GWxTD domain-containing protein